MSTFASIVGKAEALGVTKFTWTCDVTNHWLCRATIADTVYGAHGHTGEDAVRAIVEFLERIA